MNEQRLNLFKCLNIYLSNLKYNSLLILQCERYWKMQFCLRLNGSVTKLYFWTLSIKQWKPPCFLDIIPRFMSYEILIRWLSAAGFRGCRLVYSSFVVRFLIMCIHRHVLLFLVLSTKGNCLNGTIGKLLNFLFFSLCFDKMY